MNSTVKFSPYNTFGVPELIYEVESVGLKANVVVIGVLHQALVMLNLDSQHNNAGDIIRDVPAILQKYRSGSLLTETTRLQTEVVLDDCSTLRITYKHGASVMYNITFELVLEGTVVNKNVANFELDGSTGEITVKAKQAPSRLNSTITVI